MQLLYAFYIQALNAAITGNTQIVGQESMMKVFR